MAGRIRSIKPEILEDEKAAALSCSAWRLWVSMWLVADDHGRLRGAKNYLTGSVFWHDRHEAIDLASLLDELENPGLIRRYEVGGQKYIEIVNWSKHQKVDHPGKPRIPEPESDSRESFANGSRTARESFAPDQDHDHDHRSPTCVPPAPAREYRVGGFDFQATWSARTGIAMPDSGTLIQAKRLLEQYATATGTTLAEVTPRALDAFRKRSESWSAPQPLSPALFAKQWDAIQALMAGGVPRATSPPKGKNGVVQPCMVPVAGTAIPEGKGGRVKLT